MSKWFVAFKWLRKAKTPGLPPKQGDGNAYITSWTVPTQALVEEMTEFIKRENDYDEVVVLNFIKLEG